MSYNTKNYMEQGGEKWVIGGTLEIKEEATVTGLTAITIEAATSEALGGVKAEEKTEGDTVSVKIDEDGKLYVPTYPTIPETPVAGNQADSTATDVPGLVADLNTLLANLKIAGLMTPDTP